jgi:hypothetical protein
MKRFECVEIKGIPPKNEAQAAIHQNLSSYECIDDPPSQNRTINSARFHERLLPLALLCIVFACIQGRKGFASKIEVKQKWC